MNYTSFSKTGLYHLEVQDENQDALHYGKDERFVVLALADGVSSCGKAKAGAEIAASELVSFLLRNGKYFMQCEPKTAAFQILEQVIFKLTQQAQRDAIPVEEYSSTLSGVLLDRQTETIFCINLGDGMILANQGDRCLILAQPSDSRNGCYVTTTRDAVSTIRTFKRQADDLRAILLCSDGAWLHLYQNGKLKTVAEGLILQGDFVGLQSFLEQQQCKDDCSFLALTLKD